MKLTPEQIDDLIDEWHDADGSRPEMNCHLSEWLGWTDPEYKRWFDTGEIPDAPERTWQLGLPEKNE